MLFQAFIHHLFIACSALWLARLAPVQSQSMPDSEACRFGQLRIQETVMLAMKALIGIGLAKRAV
ncbi:hypothetical protein AM218_13030 [Hymenobacter sp. DG25A]|nr:hypothetical protein AM218_13030 [Hymenobacter sp. DG25A]